MTAPSATIAAPRRYVGEWSWFVDWCAGTDHTALPASQATVLAFLDAERPAAGTAGRWLAAITATHRAAEVPNPCVGLVSAWVRHARAAGAPPDTTMLLARLADTVRRLPLSGWPGGLFARRDRLAYLLHTPCGVTVEQLTRLRIGDITFAGPRHVTVNIDDFPVAVLQPVTDPAACVACGLVWWLWAVQHIDNSATTAMASTLTHQAAADSRAAVGADGVHVCEQISPVRVHGPADWPLLPAINRWGHTAVPPPPPISDRGLAAVLNAIVNQTWHHHPVPIGWTGTDTPTADNPTSATVPVARARLTDLAGLRDGVAARTRARHDLDDAAEDWDAIDTATDQLNDRIQTLLDQAVTSVKAAEGLRTR